MINNATAIYARVGDQSKRNRRSTRLRELAYQAIKDAILNGVIDTAVPLVEERLAAGLEISRTPVREALSILEHEGLIESIPYKGLFVKATTAEEFALLHEAATVLTGILAQQAAQRMRASDVVEMANLLDEVERRMSADASSVLAARRALLERLGRKADNPYLTEALISTTERADLHLMSVPGSHAPVLQAAVADLRALLAAVAAGVPEALAHTGQQRPEPVRTCLRATIL